MTARTEVLLDAQPLSSVAAASGIGSYTRHLLAALAQRPDLAVRALCEDPAALPPGVEAVPLHRLTRQPRLELWEHALRLPVEVRRHRGEGGVFHNPAFHAPAAVGAPYVQTLHDVIPLLFDAPDQAALRARWKRFGPRYRRADMVVAVSQHAADEGTRVLGLHPARVVVAPHGVGAEYTPGSPPVDGRPYLLVVSEFSRRKGFDIAFAVMDSLVDAGYPHRLVMAGQVHDWGRQELDALHAGARHPERIEIRGYVPDIVSLYQGATAYLMTSRLEGFGLPALEAMACGTPVVAFDNSSLHEVVGGGGLLVTDGDVAAFTTAVRSLLDDDARRREVAEAGVTHARSFTWERSAAIHAAAYRAAADAA
ncbi:MAG TPA: glycosyltransferase family 1 protein [Acidimicrobiales bacterium]